MTKPRQDNRYKKFNRYDGRELNLKINREYSRKGYSAKYWSVTCTLPEFCGRIKYSTQKSRRKYKAQ